MAADERIDAIRVADVCSDFVLLAGRALERHNSLMYALQQVDDVLCHKNGKTSTGTLHLTPYHLIFKTDQDDEGETWVRQTFKLHENKLLPPFMWTQASRCYTAPGQKVTVYCRFIAH
jgi:hypothetical protein